MQSSNSYWSTKKNPCFLRIVPLYNIFYSGFLLLWRVLDKITMNAIFAHLFFCLFSSWIVVSASETGGIRCFISIAYNLLTIGGLFYLAYRGFHVKLLTLLGLIFGIINGSLERLGLLMIHNSILILPTLIYFNSNNSTTTSTTRIIEEID